MLNYAMIGVQGHLLPQCGLHVQRESRRFLLWTNS